MLRDLDKLEDRQKERLEQLKTEVSSVEEAVKQLPLRNDWENQSKAIASIENGTKAFAAKDELATLKQALEDKIADSESQVQY